MKALYALLVLAVLFFPAAGVATEKPAQTAEGAAAKAEMASDQQYVSDHVAETQLKEILDSLRGYPKPISETFPGAAKEAAQTSGDICQCEVRDFQGRRAWCWVQTMPGDRVGAMCFCSSGNVGRIVSDDCNT